MNKFLKFGGFGCIGLIGLGIIMAIVSPSTNNQTNSNTEQAKQKVEQDVMQINVLDLADDFDSNQVAAEAKWKGKLVEFSAEVSNITDSGLSFTRVATKEFSFTSISCRISDKQQLLTVKNGQTVTVRGIVGGQTIGIIDVSSCSIVN